GGSGDAIGRPRPGCEGRIRKGRDSLFSDGICGAGGIGKMNSKLETVANLKRLTEQFRGILGLAGDLEKWGPLENAIQETQTLIRVRQEECFRLQQMIDERKRQLATIQSAIAERAPVLASLEERIAELKAVFSRGTASA